MEALNFNKPKDPDSQNKFNQILSGVVFGLIGPLIGFWLYYLMVFSYKTPMGYVEMFFSTKDVQSKILSLSILFNLALFFIFLKFDFRSTALGILYATFAYIPVVLYLKLF